MLGCHLHRLGFLPFVSNPFAHRLEEQSSAQWATSRIQEDIGRISATVIIHCCQPVEESDTRPSVLSRTAASAFRPSPPGAADSRCRLCHSRPPYQGSSVYRSVQATCQWPRPC